MNILVVEDDDELACEISEYFRRRLHKVTACHSLAEARILLDGPVIDGAPEVIFCDANLPDGNGVEFCLRSSPGFSGRWVLMSGAHDSDRIEALSDPRFLRRVAIVDKPVSLKALDKLLAPA